MARSPNTLLVGSHAHDAYDSTAIESNTDARRPPEDLSDEDQKLKDELDMLVERISVR